MAKKEIDGNTTTEEITTIIDQPKTVGNTPAITVENGTELTIGEVKTVTVNQPQIAGSSSAITVEKGTVLTSVHDNDSDNILQECLDAFASCITVVDQYLKEGAEELEDYNGDNWGRKFVSECAQGYLGRGGNVSVGKIAGVIGKSIWSLVYGATAGSITMVSHPLETIEKSPAILGDTVNVYIDGNWTQKLELTLEMAAIFYGSAKLRKMGEGGATEAGKFAEGGEAAGVIDGVVGEAAEAIEGAAGKGKIRIESAGESGKQTITSTVGNEIDVTPSSNHTSVNKNPGPYGEANTSVDILDADGNIKTRRWYDSDGKAYRDVDMSDHGNPKEHPEVPHEHTWEYNNGKPKRN